MSSSGRPLIIGLKYCGGCKPDYDRVALAEKIAHRLAGTAVLVRHDHPGVALILAVQGCATACADLSPFEHLPVFIITRPKEVDAFIEFVQDWLNN